MCLEQLCCAGDHMTAESTQQTQKMGVRGTGERGQDCNRHGLTCFRCTQNSLRVQKRENYLTESV